MKTTCTWLLVASLLGSCATERVPLAIDAQVDSTLVAAGLLPLSVRKVKFTGPVTFQVGGTGNVATAIAKTKDPAATAPHAVATAKGGLPWYVYAGLAAVMASLGFYLRDKVKIALPF